MWLRHKFCGFSRRTLHPQLSNEYSHAYLTRADLAQTVNMKEQGARYNGCLHRLICYWLCVYATNKLDRVNRVKIQTHLFL
ncbi:unnamed protein product [Periconia digitata]|uniref:Uncharacterized protein n=1 Tax=Periconia digitata TaxID=1303443 RepID=A0A9W4UPS8_9PLEO|nr:unnamed protein product [Periconia digitata]